MSVVPTASAVQSGLLVDRASIGIDVARERRATVGVEHSRHFNAAGAALPSKRVVSTVIDHLRREEREGGYEAAAAVRDQLEDVYLAAGEIIGAKVEEIALFDSATIGLRTTLDALRPGPGSRIVASRTTYVSHAMHLMTLVEEHGVELVIAPVGDDRCTDLATLEEILAVDRPTILTIAHIPTSSGLVEPVDAIGDLASQYGARYIVDATQSVGHIDIDVSRIGCDALVTTGRKFLRAPRGTGFAYIAEDVISEHSPTAPDVRGSQWTGQLKWEVGPTARRFETWEAGTAARLGLGVALREARGRGMKQTEQWLRATGHCMRERLRQVPGVVIADPSGADSAIVTFVVEGYSAAAAVDKLAASGIRLVSVPATHGQWDLGDRDFTSVLRASAHVYTDDGDIDALIEGVESMAGRRA